MEKIFVKKLTQEEREKEGIPAAVQSNDRWSVWECAPSAFDWHYADKELAYLYEGRVIVKASQQEVEITAGDYVVFPKGLSCTWNVLETIRKVYRFE